MKDKFKKKALLVASGSLIKANLLVRAGSKHGLTPGAWEELNSVIHAAANLLYHVTQENEGEVEDCIVVLERFNDEEVELVVPEKQESSLEPPVAEEFEKGEQLPLRNGWITLHLLDASGPIEVQINNKTKVSVIMNDTNGYIVSYERKRKRKGLLTWTGKILLSDLDDYMLRR